MSSPYREMHVPTDTTKKTPWVIYLDENTRVVEIDSKTNTLGVTHPHFAVETKEQDSLGETCWILVETVGPQSGQRGQITLYKVLGYLRGT